MNKLQRVSQWLQYFFLTCLVITPVLNILCWVYFEALHLSGNGFFLSMHIDHDIIQSLKMPNPISPLIKGLGFAASLLLTIPSLMIFYQFSKLFGLFKANNVFSKASIQRLRWIGYSYLAWCSLIPFHEVLMSYVLTLQNPPGDRLVTISFGTTNLESIITALLVIVVAWILEQAYTLKQQETLTI